MNFLIFLKDPIFVIIGIVGIALQLLTCYWMPILIMEIRKLYKSMKKQTDDPYEYYFNGNQQLIRSGYTAEYYRTQLIKVIYLLVICISEELSGIYLIVKAFIEVDIYIQQRDNSILHQNGSIICKYVSAEKYINFLLALEAPSYLVPLGLINSLIIYLTIKNAFFNRSYIKLIWHAVRALAEILIVSTLTLIPSTTTISQVVLEITLMIELCFYIISSRKLARLITSRIQDLQFENSIVYKKARKQLGTYKLYSKIYLLCGITFQMGIFLTAVQRILDLTLVNPCILDSTYNIQIAIPATAHAAVEQVTRILFYPIQILYMISFLLFMVPYSIFTIKHGRTIIKNWKRKYTYRPKLAERLEPLINDA